MANVIYINDVINDKIEKAMSVKKKQNNQTEQLSKLQENVQGLNASDRAMIYAIVWCSSDKSNLEHYPMDNLMEVATRIKNFIE